VRHPGWLSEAGPGVSIPRLEAKLHAPRLARGLVPRARLAARVVRGGEPVLTLVSAPAGFGKTTLLAEWFDDRDRPTAWLSLDRSDSDVAVFCSYLIAAVQSVVPEAGHEASALLTAGPAALQAA